MREGARYELAAAVAIAVPPQMLRRLHGRAPTDRASAAGPFDVRVRRPWRPGVLLVGDAAGYVDALTGEGVGLALEQAALLSGTVVPALRRAPYGAVVDSGALARFAQAARIRSRSNRQLTRLLVRVARHPALVERIVARLARDATLFAHLLDVNMGRRELWRLPMPTMGWRAGPGA
jgi:flavin-dependent dehydrogenase